MRSLTTLPAAALVAVALCAVGPAQDANRSPAVVPPTQDVWGGFPMMFRASTAAEGAMRGMGDLVRSAGSANLLNSAAAVNVEAARSQYIDNRLQGAQNFFRIRQLNRDYRDANRRPRPTSEQIFRLAREATPRPLDPQQYHPVSGQITWPTALMLDEFTEYRETLEDLFQEKARAMGTLNLQQINQARDTTGQMRDLLRAKINDMPPQIFTQSSAFLRQLDHGATRAGL